MVYVGTVNSSDSCWFLGDRDTDYRGVGYGGDLSSLTWNARRVARSVQSFILCGFCVQDFVQLLRVGVLSCGHEVAIQYMTRKEHGRIPFQNGLPGCCVNGDRREET